MIRLPRRNAVGLLGSALFAPALLRSAWAEDKLLKIGMTFPVTGTLALQAGQVRDAVLYAIGEANEKGGIAGYKFRDLTFDDASPTTGQYDPALAATNARKLLQDAAVIAAVGPLNSGSAKAVSPIYSQGGMATISGSATNPDLTDPKFAAGLPSGQPADILPHRDDGCLSGTESCELLRGEPEDPESRRAG